MTKTLRIGVAGVGFVGAATVKLLQKQAFSTQEERLVSINMTLK